MWPARSGPICAAAAPAPRRPPGKGVADEVATATTDVAGEVLGVDVAARPAGPADDLSS